MPFSTGLAPNRPACFRIIRISSLPCQLPSFGSCASRTPPSQTDEHLPSFALETAFPSAVVGRDSDDSYGGSGTVGLAPRRQSRGPSRLYVRAHRRQSVRHLCCLIGSTPKLVGVWWSLDTSTTLSGIGHQV